MAVRPDLRQNMADVLGGQGKSSPAGAVGTIPFTPPEGIAGASPTNPRGFNPTSFGTIEDSRNARRSNFGRIHG